MSTPKVRTAYMAEFRLWVIARPWSNQSDGHETSWIRTRDGDGPAVFVSALDAEIYRQSIHIEREPAWQRCPLEAIDLAQMAAELGGSILCHMAFGFSANPSGQLTLRDGNLRPLCISLPFDLGPGPKRPITFNFNQWVFDHMCAQWEIIGAGNHPSVLERINELDDATLREKALKALSVAPTSGEWEHGGDWAVFMPDLLRWHFGPQAQRQVGNLH